MMTRAEFNNTNHKCTYEEYLECCCELCGNPLCIHRDTYRRLPRIEGGLGLCANLFRRAKEIKHDQRVQV